MKRVQRLTVARLNRASIDISEAVHEVIYNKIYEGICEVEAAQAHLRIALVDLKALHKSQKEGG